MIYDREPLIISRYLINWISEDNNNYINYEFDIFWD